MSRTVARLLAESLEAHDVDQVYCVPGESYVGLTSVLIERNSIRVIVCRHEGGAGYMRHLSTEAIVEENKLRLKAAERLVAEGEPLVTAAAEEVKAADQRRGRVERGENVALPGKPPTLKELGITPAHAEHALALAALTPEQFERFLKFGRRPSDYRRRDYAELRRFLRAEARRNQ
jgi:hypothetical protein